MGGAVTMTAAEKAEYIIRDALLAFRQAVAYVNAHYPVTLEQEEMQCEFSSRNAQCIRERCPFHR